MKKVILIIGVALLNSCTVSTDADGNTRYNIDPRSVEILSANATKILNEK